MVQCSDIISIFLTTKDFSLMKTKKTKRKFSHHKIKLTEIEAIERDWAMRYNSEIPKWQQEMYQ